ncbi:uncharacterized protein RCO7_15225 [Rhynchosporium graminicola]|uniref:Uncharacterized protein n=1 Tax=Rhynchosporium graminicola TaxID=2792576 RepID=A0A1E1LRN9_9HELO|nr:uncharacterized protein RCO7_15225 [Rhynchosporium commune]
MDERRPVLPRDATPLNAIDTQDIVWEDKTRGTEGMRKS